MKKCFLLVIFVAVFAVAISAQDPQAEIKRIREIQSLTRNTSWTPGMTSVANLSNDEFRKMCGFVPRVEEPTKQVSADEPENRAFRGFTSYQDMMPAVRNQGKCGSCWAFAMTACVEYIQIKNGTATQQIDLSEQQLVSCCDKAKGCNGGQIAPTGEWIIGAKGLVEEKEYPYVSGENGEVPACKTPGTKKYTIGTVKSLGFWVFPASTEKMKAALDDGYVIDTGMYVYEDFRYYKEGVYEHVSGELLGGHAVTIVGYDDAQQCFIVRNSWGTGWGDKGYFKIRYGNSNIGMQAAYVK